MKNQFESFRQFYPFYLSQHRHPVTRGLHIAGLAIVFALILAATLTSRWWLFALIPFAGYGPAWIGHFFFEKNRPATFQHPLYSLMGDIVMFKDTLLRRRLLIIFIAASVVSSGAGYSQETETQPASKNAVVRFIIANQGRDVEALGTYAIFRLGEREKELGYAYSGFEARIPPGVYDIRFTYRDGTVVKEMWMEKKKVEGVVEEVFEMDVRTVQVRFTLTNQGQTVGSLGRYTLYRAGDRGREVASVASGESVAVLQGAYDVRSSFKDGTVHYETWLENQNLEGEVDRTVALDVKTAELVLILTRLGQPSEIAWCGVYRTGQRTDPIAKGKNGDVLRVAQGVYDAGCFYEDAGVAVERWFPNETLQGRRDFPVAFDFQRATFRVADPPDAAPPVTSLVEIYPKGQRDKPIARGVIGDRLAVPAGVYDVVFKRDERETAWTDVAIEGDVTVPSAETQAASRGTALADARNGGQPSPETAPETIPAETQPAATPETAPSPAQPPQKTTESAFPASPPNLTTLPAAPSSARDWFGCGLIPRQGRPTVSP